MATNPLLDPNFGSELLADNPLADPDFGKPSGVGRRLADQGISLARGVIGVPEMLTGLADIPTGGRVGQALEKVGVDYKRAKEYLNTFQSPEQQAANQAVAEAKGFLPTIGAALQNPSFIAQQVVENVPTMLGGGAISQGIMKGATKLAPSLLEPAVAGAARALSPSGQKAAIAAGAAGEGIVTAGQNVEQVRQESPTGTLTPEQVGYNVLGGALTGGLAFGGGRLANKLGLADVETLLAGGKVTTAAGKAPPGIARRVGGGILSEGLLQEAPQSYQEQVFQNLSLGKPALEGAAEAAAQGALVGGVMGGGANVMAPRPTVVPVNTPAAAPVAATPSAAAPAPAVAPPIATPLDEWAHFRQLVGDAAVPAGSPLAATMDDILGRARAAGFTEEQIDAAGRGEPVPAAPAAPVVPAGPLTKALGGTVAPAPAVPDAGPLSKTATMAPAPVDESHPEMPAPVAPPLDLSMQNRDRSRPGSIEQMNAIAAAPDYDRLGVGRSPNEAAPMVSVAANAPEAIPPQDFGHSSRVVMADNSKIAVRYAVVEAPAVLASHNVDGSVNGDYFADVPRGTIRALNNGRVAALQAAWQRGTAEQYKAAMIEDAKAHGIAPEAIMAKKNPMLVRVYDDVENSRPNIGALSNPQVALKPSAPETAHNDARILDAAALVPDDSGSVMGPQNESALRQFLQAIPASERNDLVGKGGYTKQFSDRVRAALFAKAYGNTDLVSLATEDADPDIKNVLHALTAAAPEFAKVEPGGPLDVRPALLAAANMIREAKSKGMKPAEMMAQGDLMQREPMTRAWAGLMATNIRSPRRIAAAIQEAARFLGQQKEAATAGDMFGGQKATAADLFARVNKHLEDNYGPETQLRAAEQASRYQEPAPGARGGSNAAPGNISGQPTQQQRAAVAPAGAQEGVVGEPVHDYANYLKGERAAVLAPGNAPAAAFRRRLLLKMVRKASDEGKPTFDATMAKAAADVPGAEVMAAPVKGPARAVAKISVDYKGDPTKIKDLVRGTIKVQSLNDVPAAIAAIRKHFGDVPAAGKFRNSLDPTTKAGPDGYRDVLYNVLVNGDVAELQVNHPDMLDAKERMHKKMEERDAMVREAFIADRDLTPEEVARRDQLNAEMAAVYGPIFDKLVASARNSASESGGQPRSAASAGNLRPGGPGAQATAPERPGLSETATPSTLKNVVPLGKESGRKDLGIGGISNESIAKTEETSKVSSKRPLRERIAERKAERAALLDKLVPIFERDGIIVARRGERSIAFMENAHGTSKFRIQYFDGDKPLGHLEYPSLAAAIKDDHFDGRYKLDENTPWNVAQDVFKLAGQTPTQAKLAEMLKRRQAAEAARKQAAPPPEGFALAGSTRAADLAISQGQQELFVNEPLKSWNPAQRDLFEQVDAAVQKAAGQLDLRSDENTKSRTARESALRELTQAGRLSVLAAAINVDMVKDGTASLLGRQITSLHDLATLAQVYRDPRFETLRYIFVKNGKVVHETAVSSRLPAASAAFAGDWQGFMNKLVESYKRVGADGIWLAHNHPSGNPQPSPADKSLTGHLDRILSDGGAKLLGHVVVDTEAYGIITKSGNAGESAIWAREWAMDVVDSPELGKQKPFKFEGPLGSFISGPNDIAEAAAQIKRPEHAALIGLTADGRVSALAEIPHSELKPGLRLAGRLNRFARASGAGGGIFLAKVPPTQALLAKDLVRRGILRDAILESGTSTRLVLHYDGAEIASFTNMGHADRRGARLVSEPTSPYNPVDLFGNAVEVKVTTRKRIRTVAPEIADLFGPLEKQPGLTDNKGTPTRKPQAVFPGFGDLFGENNGPDQNGTPGVGGQESGAVPPTGRGGQTPVVLPGEGGANLGSGSANGGQQPASPQGVEPREQAVPGGEGGGGEQPAGNRPGTRVGRLPGVPAGRDIPAKTGRNYAFGPDDLTYTGGWLTKGRQNVAAIKLLRQLETEGRQATREEQAILAKYVGWGAGELANKLFGPGSRRWDLDQSWSDLRNEVEDLLTEDELAEASKSTQYAHYTSKEIVKGMWAAMRRLGFHGGAVLEPGSGIGVFPGLMGPELANNTAYTGIEFEPIAGGILKQLFPDERIVLGDFIKAPLPKDFYDVAIGNPPFAGFKVLADPEYKKHAFLLHDYFFAKTIDRVKPGGLVMFVSSHGTMDKKNDKARQYLAERADLVGAIRLPQTAFKKNAGTEVVTDVLFLRKKVPGETFDGGQAWLGVTGVNGENGRPLMEETPEGKKQPILINEYFTAHPEMVLGTHSTAGSMRSKGEYTVLPREGDIEQHFLEAVSRLPENIYRAEHGTAADESQVRNLDFDPKAKKEGGFYLSKSGVLMRTNAGVGRPAEKQDPVLKSYVPLRDAVKQAQFDQLNNGPWENSLKELQKAYRRFVAAHGRLRTNTTYERTTTVTDDVTGEEIEQTNKYRRWKHEKTLLQDPDYWLVAALEVINEETDEITEAPALRERVLEKPKAAEIKTPADALAATLNETGKVDIGRIAELANVTPEEAIAGLEGMIYLAPSGEWQTADAYLSGNVRKKLDEALAAAASDKKFARNVEALRTVQPREILAKDINVRLGMNFIPAELYDQFAREKLDTRVNTHYTKVTGRWTVEHRGGWNSPFDAGGMAAFKILEHAMTAAPIRITNKIRDENGNEKEVLDQNGTAAANQKMVEMQAAFREWLFADEDRAAKIVKDYNEQFNTVVPRQYNGTHMTLPGTSKLFNIFPHVKRGAWRIIQSGNTYLAHAVGAGKTYQMVISAMEQKRLGLINKPMMVVPRHMLAQFASEWQALYPTARLMVADEKSFHTDTRREFVSRASLSDVDGIIITHPAFKLLDLDPAFKTKLIEQELEEFRAALIEAGGTLNPKRSKKTGRPIYSRDPKIKQIEAAIEKMEQQLAAAASSSNKDQKSARFDEMGVDMLYVDEAHEFRRLGFPTQRQMKGIQPAGSQQAFDMWMKTRWLEEKHPGRSLVMASGTPVTNTVAELYTVMRMMDPTSLEERGISRFDQWATMFGRENTDLEPNAAGDYEQVTRFTRFANLPELAQLFRSFADVVNSDDLGKLLGDKRPTVEGGTRKIVVAPMTSDLREYRKILKQRMADSRAWKPSPDEPNNPDPVIRIIGDGRLAAIDMRFVNPAAPSDPKSKLNVMADNIVRVYKESNAPGVAVERGTQLVFSDIGLGEGVAINRGFNARAALERRLREGGIPAAEVAFIGDYNTAQKRLQLFRKVNDGKVRILIGGSRNLGTGTNVQQRLLAAHHLDTPWFPAHVEQREGRIIRAGNRNKVVQVYGYATKGSYDETMWKLVATKQRFIDQAMSGDPNLREIEDVSEVSNYEMASAMLADDERVLKLAGLRSEVERLNRLYNGHQDDAGRASREVAMSQAQIDRLEKRAIPAADEAAKKAQDLSGDKFRAKVGETEYAKRKDFGEALLARFKELAAKITDGAQQIGEISGFPIMFNGKIERDLHGKVSGYLTQAAIRNGEERQALIHDGNEDPLGVAMRAGNVIADIAKLPTTYRAYLAEQKARVHALEPKINAKFPFLQELLDKTQEKRELEADIENNPYIDPDDVAPQGAPLFLDKDGNPVGVATGLDSHGNYLQSIGEENSVENSIKLGLYYLDTGGEDTVMITGAEQGSKESATKVAQAYADQSGKPIVVAFDTERFTVQPTTQAEQRGAPYGGDLFRKPLAKPTEPGQPAGNVDHPLIFSSGMSRRTDFAPALAMNHSIGVDVGELSQNAMDGIASVLADSTAYVFVDSGAFGLFRARQRGDDAAVADVTKETGIASLSFDRVFDRYDRLATAVSKADPSGNASERVYYVMPDVVGSQEQTLAMLRQFKAQAGDYIDTMQTIVPLQGGSMSLTQMYDEAVKILGRDLLTVGIPSAAASVSDQDFMQLMKDRGDNIFGVHILGAASQKKAGARLDVLREAGYDGHVSLDANRLRTLWNAHSTRPEALSRLLMDLPAKRKGEPRAEYVTPARQNTFAYGGGLFSPAPPRQPPPNQGALLPAGPVTPPPPTWTAPLPSRLDSLIYTMQDKHIDTRRVLEAITAQSRQIADAQDVYLQEGLFSGRSANATQAFLDDELRPLIRDAAARKVALPDLEEYLWARHAEERNIQIARINPKLPDGGSGMTTADARAYLAGLAPDKKLALEALARRVDAITAGTRQALVDYKLESLDTMKIWGQTYQHYVPLQREDMDSGAGLGTGQGYSVKGPASKRAMGSTRAVENILANLAMQRERAIVRGEKNKVATSLVGLAMLNPNEGFWKVDKPPIIKYIDSNGLVSEMIDPLYKSRENVVIARIPGANGRIFEHSVVFNEHNERAMRMAAALKNLDMDQLGVVLGNVAKATRYFASINTQYNPVFGVVNLTRDVQQAMFNLTTTAIAGKQAEVAKRTLSALAGVYRDLRAGRQGGHPTSSWAQLFEEFKSHGGQTGYRDLFRNSADRGKAIEHEFRQVGEGKAKQFGRGVFGWLSDYNTAMENAVRLAAYSVGKDSGMSPERAAMMAKNLTVNFNRKGQIGTQAGAMYAFVNASIQGTARLAETLTGPLGKRIIAGGVTLGVLQAFALAAGGFDDDEPPEFIRERSLIIPLGDKKYITIPMPLGLHFIPNIGRIGTEYALRGFKNPAEYVLKLGSVFADAFNPVGSGGLSLQTLMPTVVDPFAALAENRDWTGKPIAKEDMNPLAPTPGHTRAKDVASTFSKAVSKALNYASGGTDYKPGLFSPTPDQIDYLIGQATGGVGRELMKAEQLASSAITGEALPTYKIPLVGRFYGDSGEQSSQANTFYSNLKKINAHEAEVKGRRKAGEPTAEYVRENPEAKLIMPANAAERRVSELRRHKRELTEKGAPPERIKMLDAQITQQMLSFNSRVRQVAAQ